MQLRYVLNENPTNLEEKEWQDKIVFATQEDIPKWIELVHLVIDGFPHLDEKQYLAQLQEYIKNKRALILKDADTAIGIMAFHEVTGSIDFFGVHPQYPSEYLFWYAIFIIPSGLSTALQGFCRNDGSPVLVSAAVVISTVCNIFGDWLLIFPFPMSLKGAAIATGISQTVAFLIVLTHYLGHRGVLRFHVPKLDGALFRKMAVRGLPESISQLATPVMTLCMNMVLVQYIGVNAFSIISYVASFSIAVFLGSGEGLQPLFGQSYGAMEEAELKSYFHAGLTINVVVILALPVIFGSGIIWFAFGIYEALVLISAVYLLKRSERNGIVFECE